MTYIKLNKEILTDRIAELEKETPTTDYGNGYIHGNQDCLNSILQQSEEYNENEAIDKCIETVKSLIQEHCDDHTPFRGACVTCGNYHNWDELPRPDTVIEALEELKLFKNERKTGS